jgi:hypothetical protein
VVGFRFTGVSIPKGASITNAFIQFTVDEPASKTCRLTIKGENSDNAAPFTPLNKNVSGRTKTAASITWNPSGWTTAGDAGTAQKTPDLKTIVQQIINRAGWSSGNSMVFIFTGTGTRIAESFEGSSGQAALLTIVYTLQGKQKAGDFEISVNQPIAKPEKIKCYPVPFTDKLHIEFNPAEGEQVKSYEIVNQAGRAIHQIELTENQLVMEMPDLNPGIYVVRIQTNNGSYSKLVIRK